MSVIYSIGHGRKTPAQVIAELRAWHVDTLVDVRSIPYSHIAPDFNTDHLGPWLAGAGIAYRWLGDALGGYPGRKDCLDSQGYYSYELIAGRAEFADALAALVRDADSGSVMALMCAEQSPDHCHRALMLGRELWQRHAVDLRHIVSEHQYETQTHLFTRLTHGHWHPADRTILGDDPMPIIWPRRHPY